MKKHPDKHIQSAIEYALLQGWVWIAPGNSSHAFCRLRCGSPYDEHRQHKMSVWSTPRNTENHAKQIRRKVDACQ
ncbi:hypothetical protein ISO73_09815 [Morganella morganii subsp. morganii]|uniref:Uncharacterized protein n=1 Tax=Salmonella enterica subsp. enterica serovar Chester TaxID=149386 RepID=A0A5U8SV58_SALET|nr:hypothetical protein [Morganella morganii]EBR9859401.1 hypothetical protein [Salmonella enterica subsp. enterica serovar Chester]ELA8472495.1 hypothetical protein [Morganella morganii]MBA5853086.1 hypothetical protein [Morganella morganii]MBC3975673.1 hypothetical protein [Morganella morganii]MBT0446278.1 hypothetical protein [Morganella morganii subsp. morganii]